MHKKGIRIKLFLTMLFIVFLSSCSESGVKTQKEKVDFIEILSQENAKYDQYTEGLDAVEAEAVKGVIDFYSVLENKRFDELPSVLSKEIPQDPKIVSNYYENIYKENNMLLVEVNVKTIELDEKTADRMTIQVALVVSINGRMFTQTDAVTMNKDKDGVWRVYSVELVKPIES